MTLLNSDEIEVNDCSKPIDTWHDDKDDESTHQSRQVGLKVVFHVDHVVVVAESVQLLQINAADECKSLTKRTTHSRSSQEPRFQVVGHQLKLLQAKATGQRFEARHKFYIFKVYTWKDRSVLQLGSIWLTEQKKHQVTLLRQKMTF